MTSYGNILKRLASKELILPILENQMRADEWPDRYTIEIDSSPYYGRGDGYFHPSTHPLMTARQLYYEFHPDHRHLIEHEPFSVQQLMTVSVGSSLHAVIQTQMQMAGLLGPEDIEALAVDTLIPTPGGFTPMGDLEDGDYVLAPDGSATKILKAHPIQYGRPCYRVVFRSGAEVVADADHLWKINIGDGDKTKIVTTSELAKRRHSSVTVSDPVEWAEQELPVDPWLLGFWLGDGATLNTSLAVGGQDIHYVESRIKELGLEFFKGHAGSPGSDNYAVYFKGVRLAMSALGLLSKEKFIPDCYMFGSVTQRMELLRGLLDSDGCASGHQVTISQTSERLAFQVFSLVRSLGINARISRRQDNKGTGIRLIRWNAACGTESPFGMDRKTVKWVEGRAQHAGRKSPDRDSIIGVHEETSVPVRCITVEHDSHMFLASEGFVPTHNCEYVNTEHHVRGRTDMVVHHPTEGPIVVEIKSRTGFKFDSTTIEDMPSWEIQTSLACDNLGKRYNTDFTFAILLMVETGWPFRMKELRIERNDHLLDEVYTKFDVVREAIRNNVPPQFCCAYDSKVMKSCRARHACWLREKRGA